MKQPPATWDWQQGQTHFESYVYINTMRGLTQSDQNLQIVPALASRWEISSDRKKYTFYLENLRWTDGSKLSSQDFIFAWKRLLEKSNNSPFSFLLFEIVGAEKFFRTNNHTELLTAGMRAVNDTTLEVNLVKPSSTFLQKTSFWALFPMKNKPVSNPIHIPTIGPYQISSVKYNDTNQAIRVDFKSSHKSVTAFYESEQTKVQSLFQQHKIQLSAQANIEDATRIKGTSSLIELVRFPYLCVHYLGFNLKSGPFKDRTMREKIARIISPIDITKVMNWGDTPATSFIPFGLFGHDEQTLLPQTKSDKKTTKETLEAKRLNFTLITRDGRSQAAANLIKSAIEEQLPYTVSVDILSYAEFQKRRQQGHFDLILSVWSSDFADASSFTDLFRQGNPLNYLGLQNNAYDQLLDNAATVSSDQERKDYYKAAQRIIQIDDIALVPLYYPKLIYIISNALDDFYVNPLNHLDFENLNLKQEKSSRQKSH